MKRMIVAVVATLAATAASAQETTVYRFTGAAATGSHGLNTAVSCTNFSGVPIDVRAAIRDSFTNLLVNITSPLPHLGTVTFNTNPNPGPGEVPLSFPNMVIQPAGTVAIAVTNINMVCTAQIVDT